MIGYKIAFSLRRKLKCHFALPYRRRFVLQQIGHRNPEHAGRRHCDGRSLSVRSGRKRLVAPVGFSLIHESSETCRDTKNNRNGLHSLQMRLAKLATLYLPLIFLTDCYILGRHVTRQGQ